MIPNLCIAFLVLSVHVFALDNGVGRTPAMGWNSWNHFACEINETLMRETADAMVLTGLRDAGYVYLNLDDCWQSERDPSTGRIVEDPERFPSGIRSLADYVHDRGLKLGVYSDAGVFTCQGRPGSFNYETVDAQAYADFQVDYLKYDNCFNMGQRPQPRYQKMHSALNATGRPILFSLCEWGEEDPATWAPTVGNSWRTTVDIKNEWGSILSNIDKNDQWAKYSGPGAFNDPDMLEVGNGVLSRAEERAHFALWAISKAPLLLGFDIRSVDQTTLDLVMNSEIININQDPMGIQGRKIKSTSNGHEVWSGPLMNGDLAVILLNRSPFDAYVQVSLAQLGITMHTDGVSVRDLFAKVNVNMKFGLIGRKLSSHDAAMFRISHHRKQLA